MGVAARKKRIPTMAEEVDMEPVKSYSNIHGEWEERKISLWGAAKAFISQLRPGQDMTKITIPSLFLRPYSILEEVASRMVGNVDEIQHIASQEDPADRLKTVATWLLTSARKESFNHKPYNPIIGEEHKARYELEDKSKVFFVAEQVRHHPPITAFHGCIPAKGVSVEGNSNFSVTFNGNSVTVSMLGEMRIKVVLPSGEEEIYRLSKCVPDILIQNVIFGTKNIYWSGDIAISCEQTGFTGNVEFVPHKGFNNVSGTIMKAGNNKVEPVMFIAGNTGKSLYIADNKKMKDKVKLVDYSDIHVNIPEYPDRKDLAPNSSLRLWSEVTQAIIANDMETADLKKNEIEERQRTERLQPGDNFEAKYFREIGNDLWEPVNPEWYLPSPDINPDARESEEPKKQQ